MPILVSEPNVFPDDLLSPAETSTNEEVAWWTVYTRSRQEKQLIRGLLSLEIPFYCPIVPRKRSSPAGRIRTSYIPLFANYLFMRCDGYERYRALKTNLISKTIEVSDGTELVQDLRQIQRLIQLGQPLTVETKLQAGCKVRIKSGPLTGVSGVILKRQETDFLFVAVNFLQQGALVKLEQFEVEPLN